MHRRNRSHHVMDAFCRITLSLNQGWWMAADRTGSMRSSSYPIAPDHKTFNWGVAKGFSISWVAKFKCNAAMTKFLDNKICTFSNLLSRHFPRKNSVLDDSPLCPQFPPPPKKRKSYFIVVLPSLETFRLQAVKWAVAKLQGDETASFCREMSGREVAGR